MSDLIQVKYFHRNKMDEDVLSGIDSEEEIIALEIYSDGNAIYRGIKDVVEYIKNGEY